MENYYYAQIATPTSGFTKQIFNLVNGIITASKQKIKRVVVDNFNVSMKHKVTQEEEEKEEKEGGEDTITMSVDEPENEEITSVPISVILDLDKLNYFLLKKYNMRVYDKNLLSIRLQSVYYGVTHRDKNVTKLVIDNFCDENNIIKINTDVPLNPLFGDPFIGVMKNVVLTYITKYRDSEEQNTITISEFDGKLSKELYFDSNIQSANYLLTENSIDELDKTMFDAILQNLAFTENYCKAASGYADVIDIKDSKTKKINVIHLRLEENGIKKWGENYRQKLEEKYIELITVNIDKTDENIIVSYSTENGVLAFMKNNDYKYHITEKQLHMGIEMNAILDMLIGSYCNNIFIGNFNMEKLTGSAFSYMLMKQIKSPVKQILIDLDEMV